MSSRVGFLGLGTMGGPMAGHLLKAGHDVVVWNRTTVKSEPLKAQGAHVAGTLQDFSDCKVVFICVNRSEDVRELIDQLKPHLPANTIVVDHSTIEPEVARDIQTDLAKNGIEFVDAPITGGSMGAINGTLTIFCGGSENAVDAVLPYLQAYAKRAQRVGGPGQGQMMKLANQIAVGGALIGLCETLAFAEQAGLDKSLALDMIGGGAGGSWAFQNYGPRILDENWEPGFSIKNQRKDFSYCFGVAQQLGFQLPGTCLVDMLLEELEEDGLAEKATTMLYKKLVEVPVNS